MKNWKEIGKGALAFVVWMVVLIVSAVIDESVGYFITDHKFTRIMLQAVIQSAAVIVLLILDAKIGTAIGLNILLLTVMWIFTDEGMAHSMAIIMMLGIIPVYLNNFFPAEQENEYRRKVNELHKECEMLSKKLDEIENMSKGGEDNEH